MWLSSSSFPQSSPLFLCKQHLHSSLSLIQPPKSQNGDPKEATPSKILPFHVKSITSTSNPFVKHCVKLRNSSSYRHSHGSVLLVGTTPLREMYNFQESAQEKPTMIDCLLLHDKASVPKELAESGIHVVRVNSAVMTKLSGVQSTESIDIISLVRIPSTFHSLDADQRQDFSTWFPSAFRILVLDGIQDPGNLGTLLRSAVAFGWVKSTRKSQVQIQGGIKIPSWPRRFKCGDSGLSAKQVVALGLVGSHSGLDIQDGVFLLPGCCDPFNEKALRASRGAALQLPIVCGQWSHLQSFVDGIQMKIIAGHPGGNDEQKSVSFLSHEFASSLTDTKLCLVLGSEGSGLSEKAKRVSELVSITMAGEFESLNVSVAGGIFLFMLQPQTYVTD